MEEQEGRPTSTSVGRPPEGISRPSPPQGAHMEGIEDKGTHLEVSGGSADHPLGRPTPWSGPKAAQIGVAPREVGYLRAKGVSRPLLAAKTPMEDL